MTPRGHARGYQRGWGLRPKLRSKYKGNIISDSIAIPRSRSSCPSPAGVTGRIGMLRAALEGPGEHLGRRGHCGDPTAGKPQSWASKGRAGAAPGHTGTHRDPPSAAWGPRDSRQPSARSQPCSSAQCPLAMGKRRHGAMGSAVPPGGGCPVRCPPRVPVPAAPRTELSGPAGGAPRPPVAADGARDRRGPGRTGGSCDGPGWAGLGYTGLTAPDFTGLCWSMKGFAGLGWTGLYWAVLGQFPLFRVSAVSQAPAPSPPAPSAAAWARSRGHIHTGWHNEGAGAEVGSHTLRGESVCSGCTLYLSMCVCNI